MTKTYNEKPTADWNANDFLAFIADRHLAVYGTEYTPPGRNWQAERGLIGGLIGTKGRNAKPRKYEPEVLKAFIDECLRTHKVSEKFPTVSLTWLWKYRTNEWNRLLAEHNRKVASAARAKQAESDVEDLSDWL